MERDELWIPGLSDCIKDDATTYISYLYEIGSIKNRFQMKDKFHFRYVEFEMPVGYWDETV